MGSLPGTSAPLQEKILLPGDHGHHLGKIQAYLSLSGFNLADQLFIIAATAIVESADLFFDYFVLSFHNLDIWTELELCLPILLRD
jgi:hypothetical protein